MLPRRPVLPRSLLPMLAIVCQINTAAAQTGCAQHEPLRQLFWGDLHVHTALSMDAWSFGTRNTPDDAYRFAKGEPVLLIAAGLQAGDQQTVGRTVQLERALDFAAVTDHASDIGATRLCADPDSPVYNSKSCTQFRTPVDIRGAKNVKEIVRKMIEKTGGQLSSAEVCGEDGERCRDVDRQIWRETQAAAANHQDRSDSCAFTTFVAYEYTANPELTKIHRNVIFKNDTVIERPISYNEEPDERVLWRRLRDECIDAGNGCDVLAIPHNPNLSNGNLFTTTAHPDMDIEAQRELAELRASIEPLVEMMQMKGDSECRNGMWNVLGGNDELCNFEKLRLPDTEQCMKKTGVGSLLDEGCIATQDFARYALVEGLKEQQRLGINPFQFGFIASTDTHDATPGSVEEWRRDLPGNQPNPRQGRNNGGLVAVWAEENSRSSIFDAMRRREAYGTSGPRIGLRLFAGKQFEADSCSDSDWLEQAYRDGVPMGGQLDRSALGKRAPQVLLVANQDPGTEDHPGTPLQRAQIIKGWTDADGQLHQQVIDIAGGPNKASVDLGSCETRGPGHARLCALWRDPAFDPAQNAVYYARVVENPSCRSSDWACASAGKSAAELAQLPSWCQSSQLQRTIQERAWSSPIWYQAPQ